MGVRSLQISTCMADVYLMIIWVSAAKDGEQNSWQQESSDWDLADSHPRSFRVSHLPFIFLFLAERRYAARVFNVSSDATTEWLGCLALRNYLYGHDTSLEYFIVCREARFIVLPIINLNYTHIHTHTHTFAQFEPAVICEQNEVLVADLYIVFQQILIELHGGLAAQVPLEDGSASAVPCHTKQQIATGPTPELGSCLDGVIAIFISLPCCWNCAGRHIACS